MPAADMLEEHVHNGHDLSEEALTKLCQHEMLKKGVYLTDEETLFFEESAAEDCFPKDEPPKFEISEKISHRKI